MRKRQTFAISFASSIKACAEAYRQPCNALIYCKKIPYDSRPYDSDARPKHAVGHRAARALSPQRACAAIRAGAAAALRDLQACRPAPIIGPYRLEIDLNAVAMADLAAIIPVAERLGPRTVAFAATEIADVLGWINTVSVLATSLR